MQCTHPKRCVRRYLFNAGEGFQRFCVQHKLKLNRMTDILATRASLDALGGVPGQPCHHPAAPLLITNAEPHPAKSFLLTSLCLAAQSLLGGNTK